MKWKIVDYHELPYGDAVAVENIDGRKGAVWVHVVRAGVYIFGRLVTDGTGTIIDRDAVIVEWYSQLEAS